MQTIVIAVLIIIAGLIGALVICATSLINRARAANITLRRIEETLLAINRAKVIESAVKSAGPVQPSQPTDAGSTGFLTLRELKTMSGGSRRSTESATASNRRRPTRTSSLYSSTANLQGAPGREETPAVRNAEGIAHGAADAPLQSADSGQPTAAFAKSDPEVEAATITTTPESSEAPESQGALEPSFAMSWPRKHRQAPRADSQEGTDDIIVHGRQNVVNAVPHTVPAANGELPIQKAFEAMEESPVAISPPLAEPIPELSPDIHPALREPFEATTADSAVGRELPEPVREVQAARTGNDLDESRRKKKEQELLMIISSRRRRARAGH